ncbi:unnamed protein product [Dovyalis caffra]|uniref:Uncharacterized protein n=1 Tax=Dovyalis caffra TaxID=77055 RepID=A0AAV1R5T3_9ROSI|nr:unnamed protein product [Dovyalis caffra]
METGAGKQGKESKLKNDGLLAEKCAGYAPCAFRLMLEATPPFHAINTVFVHTHNSNESLGATVATLDRSSWPRAIGSGLPAGPIQRKLTVASS